MSVMKVVCLIAINAHYTGRWGLERATMTLKPGAA